jgi:FlaA1/EpsC-like NDP-sugar epimerase
MERVLRSLPFLRAPLLIGTDVVAWSIALIAAGQVWQLLGNGVASRVGLLSVFGLVMCLHLLTSWLVGDLIKQAPIGSPTNAVLVSAVVLTSGFWSAIANALPFAQWVPFALPLIAAPLALLLQLAARLSWRLLRERVVARRIAAGGARRTLVVGEGDSARQLVRSMLSDPEGRYRPVGFLAHDPAMRGRRACGLPVLGTEADVAATVSATGCELVILAAPALRARDVQQVARTALATGVEVKTLPSAVELDRRIASVHNLRDVVAAGSPENPVG